jgi:signal transduction histidine kinase
MSSIRKANAALAAAVIFLLLSSGAASIAFVRLHTSESWVHHTREVQNSLAQVSIITARAGRLRAAYVDSGDASLLDQQADVVRDLRSVMATIGQLTVDNPQEQELFKKLQQLGEQRMKLMEDAIDLKKNGDSTLEAQALITRRIVAIAADSDIVLQNMYDNEDELLTKRQARVQVSSQLTIGTLIASLILALILFLLHHRLLMEQVRARTRAEMAQRGLSARLLTLQDEERRKFARELHDSVGQHLAATKMGISMLQAKLPGDVVLKDCLKLLDDSIAETRTISHLLHPPLLDEAGLNSACRWFVEGFGNRSGIATNLDILDSTTRFAESIELVLFRMLQESLTNVHRHSGATRADVSLQTVANRVVLRVKDNGKGMPEEILQSLRESGAGSGVGLAGMIERIHEIGGQLDVMSDRSGTEIVASVPIRLKPPRPDLSTPTMQGAKG